MEHKHTHFTHTLHTYTTAFTARLSTAHQRQVWEVEWAHAPHAAAPDAGGHPAQHSAVAAPKVSEHVLGGHTQQADSGVNDFVMRRPQGLSGSKLQTETAI